MKRFRVERVVENMKKEGLSQILVTAPASVFYLTGTWVHPGERMLALLVRDDATVTLFANRLFALQGNVDVPLVEFDDIDDSVAVLAEAVSGGKIGIDKFWPSQFTIRLMEARPDVRPVLGSKPVDEARMLKDEEELALMRESSRINDRVLEKTMAQLREGMTEEEVAGVYKAVAAQEGVGCSFTPLVCFGANCAEPHHSTDKTVLKRGDSVIFDVGVLYRSYCSDMTRTVFFEEASEEQKKVYELVRRANEAGRAAVRPGVPMKEFDRAARQIIEEAGYGEYFIHRTGHGIGLEVHEHPDCSATNEVIAQPGMVFSIEPGIYLPGAFGVRVEDLVAVTQTGGETLNCLHHDFTVVRQEI